MASRIVAKDIITLRGSAAIVSEFFGMLLYLTDQLDARSLLFSFPFNFSSNFCLLGFGGFLEISADLCILQFFSGYAANR